MHWMVGLLLIVAGQFGYPLALLGPNKTDLVMIEEQDVRLVLEDGACAIRLSATLRIRPTTDATGTLHVPAWRILDSWARPHARSGVAGGAPSIGPPGGPVVRPVQYWPVAIRVDGRLVTTTLADSARYAFEIDLQPSRLVEVDVTTRIDSVAVPATSVLEKRHYRFTPQDTTSVHVDARGLESESIASVHPMPEGLDTQTQWTWSVLPNESTVFEIVVTEFESVADFVTARHASPRSWKEAWRLAYACNLITKEPQLVRKIVEKGLEAVPESFDRRASVRAVLMHQLALAERLLRGNSTEVGEAAALAEEALAKASGRSIEAVRRAELFRGAAHALEDSFVCGERVAPWQPPGWLTSVLTALVDEIVSRDQPLGTGRKR